MRYIIQPAAERRYVELLTEALRSGATTQLHAAVAYATVGGVRQLDKAARSQIGDLWDGVEKRWLVGIDWCRSDPPALNQLAGLPNSQVRVPSGELLLGRLRCTPVQTFHPKLYVLRGAGMAAVVCGSGNLSANGLLRGCECGSLHTLAIPGAPDAEVAELAAIDEWFEAAWNDADDYARIDARYREVCTNVSRRGLTAPTEDDSVPPDPEGRRSRPLTESEIRWLRTSTNFWVDAGILGANLRPGEPGNQLDMKRFTRAFFGAPVANLPLNQEIDRITLVWDGVPHYDCTLKYGNNHMDKLNVPPPGERGAQYYRGKTLLFTRLPGGRYQFAPGDADQRHAWERESRRRGVVGRVGRRGWGVF